MKWIIWALPHAIHDAIDRFTGWCLIIHVDIDVPRVTDLPWVWLRWERPRDWPDGQHPVGNGVCR